MRQENRREKHVCEQKLTEADMNDREPKIEKGKEDHEQVEEIDENKT